MKSGPLGPKYLPLLCYCVLNPESSLSQRFQSTKQKVSLLDHEIMKCGPIL